MNIIDIFVIMVLFSALSLFFEIMIRNYKVYKARKELIRNKKEVFLKLPSYEKMVLYFWKPIDYFIEKAESNKAKDNCQVNLNE